MMETLLPNRQSLRLKGWDYSSPGHYFATICTNGRRAIFGTVVNGHVVLNEYGKTADACWCAIPAHFPSARIDEHVVMPNHVHGVIQLTDGRAMDGRAMDGRAMDGRAIARPYTLGDVIGAYKSAVSRIIGRGGQLPARPIAADASAIWHRNYWDVIVRNEKALTAIRSYIRFNPRNYHAVMNCGEPKCLGDRALLDLPKLGFLASREKTSLHGTLPLRNGEAVMSGFLSPMERQVFKAGLAHKTPLIWVKPWSLKEGTATTAIQEAITQGRLLILSPFDVTIETPSAHRAAWCNEYVLAHCQRLIIGHLNPDGMLACILSEADPDMEIVYL